MVSKTPATGTEDRSFEKQGEEIWHWKAPIFIEPFWDLNLGQWALPTHLGQGE
jgi:hypothetical protein